MPDTTKPDLCPGDRVIIDQCPIYRVLHEGHKAKVLGDPVLATNNKWYVPIQFRCSVDRHQKVWPTDRLVKIRRFKLKKPAIITLIVGAVIGLLLIWGVANFNSLVVAANQVDNSKAKIDTQLERRYELIDNIVASVKGSQAQESDVFGKIAEARKIGGQAGSSPEQAANANAAIDQQIALLPRLQEAYPELRSNEQVTRLIQELQGTAGQVASARDNYNNTVTNYNTNITSFPKNLFAGMFGYQKRELFKASKEAQTNPKVDLNRGQ